MRFHIALLICIGLLGCVAETKYLRKLVTLYKRVAKELSKKAKKRFFSSIASRLTSTSNTATSSTSSSNSDLVNLKNGISNSSSCPEYMRMQWQYAAETTMGTGKRC
eukprot:TRINITY_DN407_c0_g1_i7.p2 TRINITY_DN407_c0_g1~~TRINITY_DN407_c0_g1_i7.p2  ORF type:complete len:107 (-),score=4.57 TRINITY_DN407_c0_g1_i7:290-610(-)